jgi:hypothetical protein
MKETTITTMINSLSLRVIVEKITTTMKNRRNLYVIVGKTTITTTINSMMVVHKNSAAK